MIFLLWHDWSLCMRRQILAIYDRFGRLAFGSERLAKDCLEYVVFEKHLADEYGRWRIHGKVTPDWMPRGQPVLRTMRQPKFGPLPPEEGADDKKGTSSPTVVDEKASSSRPAVATA